MPPDRPPNAIDMGRPPTLDGKPCKFCGADILFGRTASRALMPLDVEPTKADGVPPQSRYSYDEAEQRVYTHLLLTEQDWCYVPHFGTCPETQKKPPANPELRRRWLANGGRL